VVPAVLRCYPAVKLHDQSMEDSSAGVNPFVDELLHTCWVMAQRLPQLLVVGVLGLADSPLSRLAHAYRRRCDAFRHEPSRADMGLPSAAASRSPAPCAAVPTAAITSAAVSTTVRRRGSGGAAARAAVVDRAGHGDTSRPASRACRACDQRARAFGGFTTRVPSESPARMRLRLGKCSARASGTGHVLADDHRWRRCARAGRRGCGVGNVRTGTQDGEGEASRIRGRPHALPLRAAASPLATPNAAGRERRGRTSRRCRDRPAWRAAADDGDRWMPGSDGSPQTNSANGAFDAAAEQWRVVGVGPASRWWSGMR
jgi:hypothetical protein